MYSRKELEVKLNELENKNIIALMNKHFTKYEKANSVWRNKVALWQKWIRL